MNMTSLGNLPDDLILDVVQYLDTARDIAHFEATSRRVRSLILQRGWRDFVRTRFPPTKIYPEASTEWSTVANRLSYLDRCWDKRGLYLTLFDEIPPPRRGARRGRFMGQSVDFQSVMDATVLLSTQEEFLAYGAGENLIFRGRQPGNESQDKWSKLCGRDMGYSAGTGDVTAVSIVERQGFPEVVVGRANGDLQLLSADIETLGDSPQSLIPWDESANEIQNDPMRTSPGQRAISWTEWQPQSKLLASCRSSFLTIYNLSDADEDLLKPVLYYDASATSGPDEPSLLRNVKFMSNDVLACGLGGSREPLRWGKIRPDGISFFDLSRNSQAVIDAALGSANKPNEKTTVRAIQPVSGMNENLLLSAWDDGSHRLSDLRTPSNHDAVYRDRFQPFQASSSILVYGSERFVTGSNRGPDIRFFDFRFPKPYHHSNALPCSAKIPVPRRPYRHGGSHENRKSTTPVEKCNHISGQSCTWHQLSMQDSWRPDAVMHVGNPSLDRVHCLAKSSDHSGSFYCGFRGSFVEMTLTLAEDTERQLQRRTAPPGWHAKAPRFKVSLMETGVGLCSDEMWMDQHTGVPELYYHKQLRGSEDTTDSNIPLEWSRLDSALKSGRMARSSWDSRRP